MKERVWNARQNTTHLSFMCERIHREREKKEGRGGEGRGERQRDESKRELLGVGRIIRDTGRRRGE